tara:strand:- start:1912 stop:2313 length:402 start_codon:yes stop_codon:yes gene_type:complete
MSRAYLDYATASVATQATFVLPEDMNPTLSLIAGLYRIRRGVWRPVAVWNGLPLDPVTEEPLDRSPRWHVLYCGRLIWDYSAVWPKCFADPIGQDEYEYLIARTAHAKAHDPRDPFGKMTSRIDLLTCSPPSF